MFNQEYFSQEMLDSISKAIEEQNLKLLRVLLQNANSVDISQLLESSPRADRVILWDSIDSELRGLVLSELNEDVQKSLVNVINTEEIVSATQDLEVDDIADILQDMDIEKREAVLSGLQNVESVEQEDLTNVLSYQEDVAGGIMTTNLVTVRADVSIDVVTRYIRKLDTLPDDMHHIFVVNRAEEFVGSVKLLSLIRYDGDLHIADIMNADIEPINALKDNTIVADIFQKDDLVEAPVVNSNNRLIGRIVVDDIIDYVTETNEKSILNMSGLQAESDIFSPLMVTVQRRSVWLGVNFITAILAALVIWQFEATIQEMVALAVLMPIVSSMGGIAGTQTLTIVLRALSVGKLSRKNTKALRNKEIAIGVANGLIWAVIIAIFCWFLFKDYGLAVIIGAAIIINLIVAAISGAALPLLMNKFDIDPALAGGVVLTTITDVMGFFSFLGLAKLFLI